MLEVVLRSTADDDLGGPPVQIRELQPEDLTGPESEPGQEQQHFFVRPAERSHGVSLFQHVVQDDLLTLHRAELQVTAEVFEGFGVVLAGLEQQLFLGDVVATEDSLHFLQRFGR